MARRKKKSDARSEMLITRVNPGVKKQLEKTLDEMGLSVAEAIRLFCHQVILRGKLPFDVSTYDALFDDVNEKTRQVIDEIERGEGLEEYESVEEFLKEIKNNA